jgi:hypothetical protein
MPDAQPRCARVCDRYVWVSGYVALGHLEIAARHQPDLAALSNRAKGGR